MKTKHLFLATALMASFAACTNEEIVSDVQQNVATGRPTVENVKLTFGEGVDSRLIYNKGWKWEATDQIGALLMDQPTAEWHVANTPWNQKYSLTHHIHTSYPFSYDAADKTWGTPGKMLEGNYFFAYPWESYEGQRQVAHSLINQKQIGITKDVRAVSYADNQFFIGYDRIVAGTQDAEALDNVSMTSVLGAIELRLVNTGTQTYNINKVVLSGNELASQLTFDPVEAYEYLEDAQFNSSNYLDLDDEKEWALDESEYKNYDKDEALRAVVKPIEDEKNDYFAQLIIEGDDRELLPDAENTAYILIMANPVKKADLTKLELSIYTDEGYVSGIDLTKINKSSAKYGYITDADIEEIHPEVTNVIEVQLDDNAFETPQEMNIYNAQDLEQFILWNSKVSGKRSITATLSKNVELSEAAYEALIGKKNLKLTIEGDKVLTLAAELPANALDADNLVLDEEVSVKVLGEIALTKNSAKPESIEVAEGAELTINDSQVKNASIVNFGTLTIGKNGNLNSLSSIENNGLMTVAAGANIKAQTTNNKTIELAGDLDNVVENAEEAVITMEEGATMGVTTNEGTINTEDEVELAVGTNNGTIAFVEGAVVSVTTENGYTTRKVFGAVANEVTTGTNPSPVNTWIVTKDASFAADAAIKHMIVEDGADITVADNKNLTVENLTIQGSTTTEGVINVTNMTVEADGDLTNDGKIYGNGNFKNYGFIDSNDLISYNIPENGTKIEGEYKGDITFNAGITGSEDAFNKALSEAVVAYIENSSSMNDKSWNDVTFDVIKAGYGSWSATDWAGKASKKVIDAYNAWMATEDDDYEDLTLTTANMQAILADYEDDVESYIATAKTTAATALETAITTAIANKDLTINWKGEAGYAYTGEVMDNKAMWDAYATYLTQHMASWAVKNATTSANELVYKNASGNLKGTYKLAIKSEINEKFSALNPSSPTLTVPAGSYLDASDAEGAAYNVVSYAVNVTNNGNVTSSADYTLSKFKTWVNTWKNVDVTTETNQVKIDAYVALNSYVADVMTWTAPEYSDANLYALAKLVKVKEVTTASDLKTALNSSDVKVIKISGELEFTSEQYLEISGDKIIKGGTIIGAGLKLNSETVVMDGVTMKNSKENAVVFGNSVKNLTVKNCKFDGFVRDAIQTGVLATNAVVTIDNNTFVAPTAKIEKGSYVSVGLTHNQTTTRSDVKVILKNNKFGLLANLGDKAIKVYGVDKLSQIYVGGNTFDTAKTALNGNILFTNATDDETLTSKTVCEEGYAYDAMKGSLAPLNENGKATAAN